MRNEYEHMSLYTCTHKIQNKVSKTKWNFIDYDSSEDTFQIKILKKNVWA